MKSPSSIELSREALRGNLRFLRRVVGPDVQFCSVVKGDAYGHGIRQFVPMAEDCGVRRFAVFDATEAAAVLRARRTDCDVMIMGHIAPQDLPWAVREGIAVWVFDGRRLTAMADAAETVGRPARIHLELETGLHRTGLEGHALAGAVARIRRAGAHVIVEGVCTHLAGAESAANAMRVQEQLRNFETACAALEAQGIPVGLRHAACSAAALTLPQARMDLVRVGIAQFGFWPSTETRIQYQLQDARGMDQRFHDPLRRVLRWSSALMEVKEVPPGRFIGYGTSYMTTTRQRIGAVPVGYAHGFVRHLSNLGHVLVHGRRAPVVGVVNMSMMLVDVTHIPGAAPGDEVVVIGRQDRAEITVGSFSDLSRTPNYEVLVRIPADIPRVVVERSVTKTGRTSGPAAPADQEEAPPAPRGEEREATEQHDR